MAVASEEVLGSFHGDEDFPIEWDEGEKELFWIFDDLHCPNPLSPMFFDIGGWWLSVRPHVPPLRDPVRVRLDHEVDQRLRSTWPPSRRTRASTPRRPSTTAATSPGSRATRLTRRRSAPTSAAACRTTPRTSSTGGATGCGPRSSATSSISTATTWRRRRLVELAVLLEDAIDIHDRHWKIHWMLNFAQFSATVGLNATIDEVKGEVDPESRRPPPELGRRPQLGLDRGALADEGGDQGRQGARRRLPPPGRDRGRRAGRARRLRARAAVPRRAARARTSRSSATKAIWSHEFVYPDVAGDADADRSRRCAATSRRTTTTRPRSRP